MGFQGLSGMGGGLGGLVSAAVAAVLNPQDLFATKLWTGNGTARTITNDIDLTDGGGLVWIKNRDDTHWHFLCDTVRGVNKAVHTNSNSEETTTTSSVYQFNTDGFNIGGAGIVNSNTDDFASWTWRVKPGFFTIKEYTGTGAAQTVSHDLGCKPGMIWIKNKSGNGEWSGWHKSLTNQTTYRMPFGGGGGEAEQGPASNYWNSTAPTDTHFTVGSSSHLSASGATFIAYLFADGNETEGQIFGSGGDQSIMKMGSYTGNNSTSGPTVTLGWDPQYLLVKARSMSNSWAIQDNERGITISSPPRIDASSNAAEFSNADNNIQLLPTGFQIKGTGGTYNDNGVTYMYVAIRQPIFESANSYNDTALRSVGTAIGNMTQEAGVTAAFDGTTTGNYTVSARKDASWGAWIGKNFVEQVNIRSVNVY